MHSQTCITCERGIEMEMEIEMENGNRRTGLDVSALQSERVY